MLRHEHIRQVMWVTCTKHSACVHAYIQSSWVSALKCKIHLHVALFAVLKPHTPPYLQVLVYFAVAKKGEAPIDGKTDGRLI